MKEGREGENVVYSSESGPEDDHYTYSTVMDPSYLLYLLPLIIIHNFFAKLYYFDSPSKLTHLKQQKYTSTSPVKFKPKAAGFSSASTHHRRPIPLPPRLVVSVENLLSSPGFIPVGPTGALASTVRVVPTAWDLGSVIVVF